MKQPTLIRHGESLANAGLKTDNYMTLPLSDKGKEQAVNLAKTLDIIPDLIVISPYSRTLQTAEPFIKKHAATPVETWEVQEFTYLNPDVYDGTSIEERRDAILDYWANAPVTWKASDKSESFAEFLSRIQKFVKQVKKRDEQEIIIFTHGMFIHTLIKYIDRIDGPNLRDLTEEELVALKEEFNQLIIQDGHFPIENASIHKIILE